MIKEVVLYIMRWLTFSISTSSLAKILSSSDVNDLLLLILSFTSSLPYFQLKSRAKILHGGTKFLPPGVSKSEPLFFAFVHVVPLSPFWSS